MWWEMIKTFFLGVFFLIHSIAAYVLFIVGAYSKQSIYLRFKRNYRNDQMLICNLCDIFNFFE